MGFFSWAAHSAMSTRLISCSWRKWTLRLREKVDVIARDRPFRISSGALLNAFHTSSIIRAKRKHPLVPPLDEADLIETFIRGSGPGGQAVNKTNNSVSLIHVPTGIRVQAHAFRSREANRNQARRILAERVDYQTNRGQSKIEQLWVKAKRKKEAKARQRKRRQERANEAKRREAMSAPFGG